MLTARQLVVLSQSCSSTRTTQVMLFGVLSFVHLAGGVVAFADATHIRQGLGAEYPVTAHALKAHIMISQQQQYQK